MRLALAGVSHHRAPLELRERVAVDLTAAGSLAHELSSGARGGHETVVLSTCNRTELYLAADDDEGLAELADRALLSLAGPAADSLAPVAYRLADESAALHLFRVAAGLDSMVPGEGEILGQVRDAFEAGAPGPLLDRVFRMALHAGRRARVETAIGESPASIPAAAAALAQQVFERLDGRRVVLVGAGPDERAHRAEPPLARGDGRLRPQPNARARRGARRRPRGTSGRRSTSSWARSPRPTSSSPPRARPASCSRRRSSPRPSARDAAGRCS